MSRAARLRGHHLICLQFFRGEGYSDEFVANLTAVLDSLESGGALLVAGADDVCRACPSLSPNGECASVDSGGEAEIARIDALAAQVLGVAVGETVSLAEAARRLRDEPAAAAAWRAEACAGCAWESVCDTGWAELLG